MIRKSVTLALPCLGCLVSLAGEAGAQSYGSDLHNTVMPASGGMAG